MISEERRLYLHNRFANMTEEQKEKHRKKRLEDYHSMSEYARKKEKIRRQEYYKKNREKLIEKQKKYYQENKEYCVEYMRNIRKLKKLNINE